MTGVIDEAACPQCGYEHAYTEFQTRTFEEVTICTLCGYRSWTRTLIDRKRSAADSQGRQFFKRRKHGDLVQRFFERKGYGTCCLRSPHGVASLYSFSKPLHPAQQQEMITAIQTGRVADKELDPNRSYLTEWDEASNKVVLVAGTLPGEREAS